MNKMYVFEVGIGMPASPDWHEVRVSDASDLGEAESVAESIAVELVDELYEGDYGVVVELDRVEVDADAGYDSV